MTDSDRMARAVVARAAGDLHLADLPLPALGPRDVLIRTSFSGVSTGTDKWMMQGLFTWRDNAFPLVPGYQRPADVRTAAR